MTKAQRLVKELLEAEPDLTNYRAGKVLHSRYPEVFKSAESARSHIRSMIGKNGSWNRETITTRMEKEQGVRRLPKSKAKPWEPYLINSGTIAVLGDLHFPKHDVRAIESAVTFIKNQGKVDVVLLNGDIADAEEFGSWAKSPKAVDTENAIEIVRQGLLWVVEQFPKSKIIYKLGNHEERLDRYCWNKAPELVGLPHITWEGLLKIGNDLKPIREFERIEFVGDQRPVMLGKLPVFHGHELPKGLVNAVNPARGAFLRTLDSVLINHHHRSSSHVEYNWQHKPINCWSVGCLCDLNPEYARINKWNHGFAIVRVGKSGDFSVENLKQLQSYEVVNA